MVETWQRKRFALVRPRVSTFAAFALLAATVTLSGCNSTPETLLSPTLPAPTATPSGAPTIGPSPTSVPPTTRERAPTVAPTATPTPLPTDTPTPVQTRTPRPTESPTPTLTPAPTSVVYVVRPGDSLAAIADRFDVDVQALMETNEIADSSALQVGQEIVIPDASVPQSGGAPAIAPQVTPTPTEASTEPPPVSPTPAAPDVTATPTEISVAGTPTPQPAEPPTRPY